MRIYRWSGAAWSQRGGDIDGDAADDAAGHSVALSSDGDTVAIGAAQLGTVSNGYVRVFAFPRDVAGSPPSVSCGPLPATSGSTLTCLVTGGDPGIDILWRAAYNPVFAEAGVALDASGSGEFSFTVPAASVGAELTVELVEWTVPQSLGVVGGAVPTSVPSRGGPTPVWPVLLAALAAFGLLRRVTYVQG